MDDEAALPAEGRLAVTIAGLIQREAPRGRPDHRGVALVAVVLIFADGLAMAAVRYRRS